MSKEKELCLGVHALEENAQKRYKKSFSLLKGGDRDKILSDFEKGKIPSWSYDL